MTTNIYHWSGEEKPVLNVEGVKIPRLVSIEDEGDIVGINTSGGRVVVMVDVIDFRQKILPIKVMELRRNKFETFNLVVGGREMIDIGKSQQTLFGRSAERIDRIVLERM